MSTERSTIGLSPTSVPVKSSGRHVLIIIAWFIEWNIYFLINLGRFVVLRAFDVNLQNSFYVNCFRSLNLQSRKKNYTHHIIKKRSTQNCAKNKPNVCVITKSLHSRCFALSHTSHNLIAQDQHKHKHKYKMNGNGNKVSSVCGMQCTGRTTVV